MPPAVNPVAGVTLDAWGRSGNRRLLDKSCDACGVLFRPARESSRFCSRRCLWSQNGGRNRKQESWWINSRGYVEGRVWDGDVRRDVKAHRYIVEIAIGRPLSPTEDVHHIDGNKRNNNLSNLQVLDHGVHASLSNRSRVHRRGYSLVLTVEERAARAERMRCIRRLRSALPLATCQILEGLQ